MVMVAEAQALDGRERPLWVSPLHSDFLFMSPDRSIRASGTLARLTLPAAATAHPDNLFHAAIADAFGKAHRAGITNPILIGAIPFDTMRPACLYIPQCHAIFDRTAVIEGLAPADPAPPPLAAPLRHIPERPTYEAGVASATAAFGQGKAQKVVLARLCELQFEQPIAPDWLLQRLIEQNPAGFQFRIPLPDGGTLLGASPELLVRRQGAAIACNPLAGSARRHGDAARDAQACRQLEQSEKDLREHRYVVDWMREALAPQCQALAVPERPATIATAALWHLSTQIEGRLRDPAPSALHLACALHPTPALCGYPGEAARALIRRIEPFERGFFGGIVGWCDARGDGEWAVAIRCGELRGTSVRLFAGAGIVAGSDPASEWRETGTKLSTMLRALGVADADEGATA